MLFSNGKIWKKKVEFIYLSTVFKCLQIYLKFIDILIYRNNGLMTFGTRYNAYFDGVLNSFRKLENTPFEAT